MRRMRTEERRARLGLRHRLAAETRASDPLEAARSVVALHSSDPATVFLSVWARTGGFEVEDLEEELYERRSLVRMLAMRRTLWVVPRELVAVVDAACTRTVASRERRRLEGFVAASGASDDPGAWLDEVGDAALRAVEARGEAFTSDLSRDDPLLATKVKLGIGTRWESDVSVGSRILPLLAAEGRLVRGRPRTGWTNGQYRWTAGAAWLGEEPVRAGSERGAGRAPPPLACRVRPRDGDRHPLVDGLDGTRGAGGAGRRPARRRRARRGRPVTSSRTTSSRPAQRHRGSRSSRRSTRPRWAGRSARWYLGPHERVLFDSNGNAGPTVWWDGRVVGGWSQRKDGEIVWELLEDVGAEAVSAVEAEAARLAGVARRRPLLAGLPAAVPARARALTSGRVDVCPRR